MTNTRALKKGVPPQRQEEKSIIKTDPRPTEGKNRPLQVMVPPEIFNAFSAQAGKEFGFTKGAKSQLFLAMWHKYHDLMKS